MPKRENSITITASPDVEANIAIICHRLGLVPEAHGSAQKAIRHALAVMAYLRQRQPPAASDRGGNMGKEE